MIEQPPPFTEEELAEQRRLVVAWSVKNQERTKMKINADRMGWALIAVAFLAALGMALAVLVEYRDRQARSAKTLPAQQDVPAMPSIPPAGRWVPEKDQAPLRNLSFRVDSCPYKFKCGSSWCAFSDDADAPGWHECYRAGAYGNITLTVEKMVSAAADVGPQQKEEKE